MTGKIEKVRSPLVPNPRMFPLQFDPRMRLHPAADFLAQRLDIGGRCPAEVEQEVGMLLRNLRIAYPQAPATGRIDQRPSLVSRRVLEGRPARARTQRLARLALGGDAVHLRADCLRGTGNALEQRLD